MRASTLLERKRGPALPASRLARRGIGGEKLRYGSELCWADAHAHDESGVKPLSVQNRGIPVPVSTRHRYFWKPFMTLPNTQPPTATHIHFTSATP